MNQSSTHVLKRAFYWALGHSGLDALYRRKNKNLVRIFTLHGVANYNGWFEWEPLRSQMDVGRLKKFLEALSRNYKFIPLDDAVEILSGRQAPIPNAAVLTFDDGYTNNFTEALPVLKELDIPGVFYVVTGNVESREPFWFDRLDYVLQIAATQRLEFEFSGRTFRFDSDTRAAAAKLYSDLRIHHKSVCDVEDEFVSELNSLADRLEQLTGKSIHDTLESDQWARVAKKEELATVAQDAQVTIASHTVSHMRLPYVDVTRLEAELCESKLKLEEWTSKVCKHFAFPNGDFDKRSVAACRKAGYQSAVTCEYGMNAVGANLHELNRLDIPNDYTISQLLARASGLEVAVSRVSNRLNANYRTNNDIRATRSAPAR